MKKDNIWKILYIFYAMIFVLNVYAGIKHKNIVNIEVCIWILNAIILFTCARINEKRADKFEKLYFDEVEKHFKEKVDKLKEQNESI